MGEIAGIPPFGGGGANLRPPTETAPVALAPVAQGDSSANLSGRMDSDASGHGSARYQTPNALTDSLPRQPLDGTELAGPPPSFQVSILELDRDLQAALAKITASHSLKQDVAAISLDIRPPQTDTESNMSEDPWHQSDKVSDHIDPRTANPDSPERKEADARDQQNEIAAERQARRDAFEAGAAPKDHGPVGTVAETDVIGESA